MELASESQSNSITTTFFTSNYASVKGGAISVISSSTLRITSATFRTNRAPDSNSIYALGTNGNNEIRGSTFQDNVSSVGRTVSLLFANAIISG